MNLYVPEDLDIDFNNDGKVDNIIFIIRGDPESEELLWPHRWSLPADEEDNSDFIYIHGKKVQDYIFLIENKNDVGIICHETMHVFGAPDLYHKYDYSSPVGVWDVMANTTNPPQHPSAYIKNKYCGWINSINEITESGNYTVNSLLNGQNNCFKIPFKDHTDQYLVLEYRKNEGIFESSLPNEGILIYRVNENYYGNYGYYPELRGGIFDEVYVFRPGGSIDSIGEFLNANFAADFNRSKFNKISDPNCFTSFNGDCDISVNNISFTGEESMNFNVDLCRYDFIAYRSFDTIPPFTKAETIISLGGIIPPLSNIIFKINDCANIQPGFAIEKGSTLTITPFACGEE